MSKCAVCQVKISKPGPFVTCAGKHQAPVHKSCRKHLSEGKMCTQVDCKQPLDALWKGTNDIQDEKLPGARKSFRTICKRNSTQQRNAMTKEKKMQQFVAACEEQKAAEFHISYAFHCTSWVARQGKEVLFGALAHKYLGLSCKTTSVSAD